MSNQGYQLVEAEGLLEPEGRATANLLQCSAQRVNYARPQKNVGFVQQGSLLVSTGFHNPARTIYVEISQ